jgi:hypothetical protein
MAPRHPFATVLPAAALVAASLFGSAEASAQVPPLSPAQAPPVRGERYRMTLSMEDYFEGERAAGYVFLGAGVLSLGTSAFLFTRGDEMSRGAAFPVAAFGAIDAAVGLVLLVRTSAHIAQRRRSIANDPTSFQRAERARMAGVLRQFTWLEGFEIAFAVTGLGLATYGELDRKPLVTGIGAGLTVQSLVLLGLDFLADRRAARYVDALRDFNPSVARDGFGLTWRARF